MTTKTKDNDFLDAGYDFDAPLDLERPGPTIADRRKARVAEIGVHATNSFFRSVGREIAQEMDETAVLTPDPLDGIAREGMTFALSLDEFARVPALKGCFDTPGRRHCEEKLNRAEAFYSGYQHGRGRRSDWKREGLSNHDAIKTEAQTHDDLKQYWRYGQQFGKTGERKNNPYLESIAVIKKALKEEDVAFFMSDKRNSRQEATERAIPTQRRRNTQLVR